MENKVFESGAVRSKDADGVRYDLISPVALRRLAEVYAEGAKKYGDNNWLKGIPSSDLLNHMQRHIGMWQQGDTSEDHLGHALWNLAALVHFSETRPDLIEKPYATKDTKVPERGKFEIGKCYRDRCGDLIGPLVRNGDSLSVYPLRCSVTGATYTEDGKYDVRISTLDLLEGEVK